MFPKMHKILFPSYKQVTLVSTEKTTEEIESDTYYIVKKLYKIDITSSLENITETQNFIVDFIAPVYTCSVVEGGWTSCSPQYGLNKFISLKVVL